MVVFQYVLQREGLNGTWGDIFHSSACGELGWERTGEAASPSFAGADTQKMSE